MIEPYWIAEGFSSEHELNLHELWRAAHPIPALTSYDEARAWFAADSAAKVAR